MSSILFLWFFSLLPLSFIQRGTRESSFSQSISSTNYLTLFPLYFFYYFLCFLLFSHSLYFLHRLYYFLCFIPFILLFTSSFLRSERDFLQSVNPSTNYFLCFLFISSVFSHSYFLSLLLRISFVRRGPEVNLFPQPIIPLISSLFSLISSLV